MLKSINNINRITTKTLRSSSTTNLASRVQNEAKVVPKIGLEVHAQLDLNSKLFSQGGNVYQAPSNSRLDLLDVALPGSLPKLNAKAVELAIVSSLGLNCSVQEYMHFDRKNYFYSDMPAGYQITQCNRPIARDGHIDFTVSSYKKIIAASSPYRNELVTLLYLEERSSKMEFEPYKKRSHIKQIQLEQDSAKTLTHIDDERQNLICDLVDYNRSGASLIEIVFEPDLTSHHEASSLVKELISVLQTLGTCRCELQEGTLRVDANVSIASLDGRQVNTAKVELKNLNSLKALNRGIQLEIERQTDILRSGNLVSSETRTYDTRLGVTLPLRIKEETVDYRFVPDPNLPPLRLSGDYVDDIRASLAHRKALNTRPAESAECAEQRVTFEVAEPREIETLCLDLIRGMKNISKRYARDGQSRHMFMMLDKLCELTSDKVDIYAAMKILDKLLRKPTNTKENK